MNLKELHELDKSIPINLVLSGGGIKGAAHIALLEKIEELGLKINAISASSVGALVAALYASGTPPLEILSFFKTTPLFHYIWFSPQKGGLFDTNKYGPVFKDHVKPNFEDLAIPIYVAATNIQQGETVYFHEGELIPTLLASSAVPAVFSPVEINGNLYSDGGVMDNFPILPFQQSDLPTIGSYVCKPSYMAKKELHSILHVANHTQALLLYAANKYKFQQVDIPFVFPLGHIRMFDTKSIDLAYQLAKEYLNLPPS